MAKIQLTNKTSSPALTQELVRAVFTQVGKVITYPTGFTVSFISIGDNEMKTLNNTYRSLNEVTDVLSFPYTTEATDEENGEIVICYSQAARQAKAKQTSIKRELQWLATHGILHVLGYDHETAEDAKVMRPLERTILAKLN